MNTSLGIERRAQPACMRRLLIANRGEIACRIARTARRLGMTSIAVYSDADRSALHTRVCHEAYYLGPSPPAQSYLDQERLIAVALRARAEAIHPGYGFLSENAQFARRCESAGIAFVGPPASAIEAMGSKASAKAAMTEAGVPVAPGYHGSDQSIERLTAEANRIGFPLICKASAGGGGKGMQIIRSAEAVQPALEAAKRIARGAFGDDHLLLERYFARARHVEVQIFAGADGEVMALGDRDCSIQRRHQKVIEECPAPGLAESVRQGMAAAAIRVAQAVGYRSAGTVEFLFDEPRDFYFMEMNTRLQVEHPVTEMVYGVDLVEWQLRTARGEPLRNFCQARAAGHAIEARLYAEDPARDYLPSVGVIDALQWPRLENLRVDTGVEAGDAISSFYDPMLAKIIAWAPERSQAIETLRVALDRTRLIGLTTNRSLLQAVLADSGFVEARLSTALLADQPQLAAAPAIDSEAVLVALGVWLSTCGAYRAPDDPWSDSSGFRPGAAPMARWTFDLGTVSVQMPGTDVFIVTASTSPLEVRCIERRGEALRLEWNGEQFAFEFTAAHGAWHVVHGGRQVAARLVSTDDFVDQGGARASGSLVTPLPGTVIAVHVGPGDVVSQGAALAIVEAMKMEHTLVAPRAGRVARVLHHAGERVDEGAVLVELESEPAPSGD